MLKLILMRHAKSSWDTPGLADHDRPLNARGVRSAKAMGDWLRSQGHVPEQVLSSTSLRTKQTLDELALGDQPAVFTRNLYHASAEDILDVIHNATGTSLLVLGHNPGFADFARRILSQPPKHPRFADFPTCATLVAGIDTPHWSGLRWGNADLIDFAIPREVLAE